jgi:hypothetical protein
MVVLLHAIKVVLEHSNISSATDQEKEMLANHPHMNKQLNISTKQDYHGPSECLTEP